MLADPTTLGSSTIAFSGSWPAASESAVQGKVFNKLEQSGGTSRFSLSQADLSSMVLTKGEVSVKHQVTNQGRMRSLLRTDVSKADAAGVDHSVSIQLVIDREVKVSTETTTALSRALGIILLLLNSGTGSGALSTTSVFAEFLNGES